MALDLLEGGAGVECVGDEAGVEGVAGVVAVEPRGNGRSLDDLCGTVAGDGLDVVELAAKADKDRAWSLTLLPNWSAVERRHAPAAATAAALGDEDADTVRLSDVE